MTDNPIVKRQKQLTRQWLEFTSQPEARLCRWLIAAEEASMLKAFYLLQDSEGNDTGDLFIKLSAPFSNPADYTYDLQKEFLTKVHALQEEVDEPAVKKWRPLATVPGTSPILQFLSNLGSFAQALDLPESYLVIYLQPQTLNSSYAWSDWLVQVMQFGIPQKVKWMLTDSRQQPILGTVAKFFSKKVISITPDLKMNAAVNELASAGDPANPGVQFRKAFVHLTQAIGKQDMDRVEMTASKAFNIATSNQWPHMKVAVNMAKGGAYLGKQQYEQAYQIYGQAYQDASKAYKAGDAASGKLAVTTLFSQGAAMLSAEKYEVAARSYTQAIPYAQETEDYYQLMEALRMAGFCYQRLGDDEHAWDLLWQAMETGPKLDEQLRPNSTLPYIGQELLMMAEKAGHMDLYRFIQDRMVFLVGEDWSEKVNAS